MTTITAAAPSTAESVRSTCLRAEHVLLSTPDAEPTAATLHALRAPGELILAAPTATLGDHDAPGPAVVELVDRSPLPLRERVRSVVWLRGELRRVPAARVRPLVDNLAASRVDPALLDVGHTTTLLALTLHSVVVADAGGAESVPVADVLAAEPDPFAADEAAWLTHLDSEHSDLIAVIGRRLPRGLRRGGARPLGLDRFGLTLRIEGTPDPSAPDNSATDPSATDRDVRLPFPAPVDSIEGLGRALRILAGCPFLNGLRAGG